MVRVNDRGPAAWTHRDIDLSEAAARKLGLIGAGVGAVQIKVVH
jgi:rare lipoprotein A